MYRGFFWALLLIPIIEIAVLIQVGSAIGVLWTVLLILLTAVIGTALLRAQGLSVLLRGQSLMASGQLPAREIAEGVGLAVGGALLLTPGFVTDAIGFCLLIPVTRGWLLNRVLSQVQLRPGAGPAQQPGTGPTVDGSHTIEGEFRRDD